ncbi:MAG: nucleoside hydrolase [Planctomycetota bacterium]
MIPLLLALLVVQPAPADQAPAVDPVDVWLDVDTSTGVVKLGRNADVDDGLFMIYCFNSPELNVRGISVQFGNATLEQAVPIAEDITRRFGPADLPIHAGAASADDLDKQTDATRAIAAALREKPMHVMAVGPVTNIAAVLKAEPDLAENVQSIVVVAARRVGFRFGPVEAPEFYFPDLNFESDPAAMQVLIDSGVPIVFAGYEVSSHVWITHEDLDQLAEASDVGRWIHDTSQAWIGQWLVGLNTPGFNPFDTLAAMWLTHPELIESVPVDVRIIESVDERAPYALRIGGATREYLLATPAEGESRFTYLTVPAAESSDIIVERLSGPAQP